MIGFGLGMEPEESPELADARSQQTRKRIAAERLERRLEKNRGEGRVESPAVATKSTPDHGSRKDSGNGPL